MGSTYPVPGNLFSGLQRGGDAIADAIRRKKELEFELQERERSERREAESFSRAQKGFAALTAPGEAGSQKSRAEMQAGLPEAIGGQTAGSLTHFKGMMGMLDPKEEDAKKQAADMVFRAIGHADFSKTPVEYQKFMYEIGQELGLFGGREFTAREPEPEGPTPTQQSLIDLRGAQQEKIEAGLGEPEEEEPATINKNEIITIGDESKTYEAFENEAKSLSDVENEERRILGSELTSKEEMADFYNINLESLARLRKIKKGMSEHAKSKTGEAGGSASDEELMNDLFEGR